MPEEKITFVNGEPAKCGCQMEFSSGGGEYSDVLYVMPCPNHSPKSFGPVEVKRDKDGWWWHPASLNSMAAKIRRRTGPG